MEERDKVSQKAVAVTREIFEKPSRRKASVLLMRS